MGEKKTILAIDDEMMLLDLFKKMLTPEYNVQTVSSASDAINYLNNNKADVILLDIEMPNISGFEFLKDIREIPSYMDAPIIIVSGNSGEDFLNKAKNSSAFDVLTKPVKKEVLIDTIERSMAKKN